MNLNNWDWWFIGFFSFPAFLVAVLIVSFISYKISSFFAALAAFLAEERT